MNNSQKFFKSIVNKKGVNKATFYTVIFLFFITLIAFLTFGPLNTPIFSKLGQNILKKGGETKGIEDTIEIEKNEIIEEKEPITEEIIEEKEEMEKEEKTITPVSTSETVSTPSYTPPASTTSITDSPKLEEETPSPEPKCSEGTIVEYNRQIRIYTDLKDYYIESAAKIFTEDTLRCQDDYDYCVSQISIALTDYDRTHPSCYMSGRCQADRENLEKDLNRACENTQLTCIGNAKTKQRNDSWVIKATSELASYERLLAGCL